MRNKLLMLSSLALTALLVTGAGCTPTTTTTTTNANTNTTVVAVDDTEDTDADEDTDTEDENAEGNGSINIVSPVEGATVGADFDVTVEITGLTLAPDEVEGENVEGHGHYHVWVDGEYVAAGAATTTSLTDIEAGEHQIMVSLQENDHSDLPDPVASDPVTVNVVVE